MLRTMKLVLYAEFKVDTYFFEKNKLLNVQLKAKMYAISSDTHKLQFLKLHRFKLERI